MLARKVYPGKRGPTLLLFITSSYYAMCRALLQLLKKFQCNEDLDENAKTWCFDHVEY
jgi:hypothetical protein